MIVVPVARHQRAMPSVRKYFRTTPTAIAHTNVNAYSWPAASDDTRSPAPTPVAAMIRPGPTTFSFPRRPLGGRFGGIGLPPSRVGLPVMVLPVSTD